MVKGGPREAEEVGKDGQTERWRRGETMKKTSIVEEDRRRTGEQHGGWFHRRWRERTAESLEGSRP